MHTAGHHLDSGAHSPPPPVNATESPPTFILVTTSLATSNPYVFRADKSGRQNCMQL
ncbi:hypothetical protein HanIR_Chr08g0352061 [Helianthus annuus]|nr:hypothetical protein HanIR_Chr08g0352061 [Helianthus annuus]